MQCWTIRKESDTEFSSRKNKWQFCARCNENAVPPNKERCSSGTISIQSVADVPVAVYCVWDVTSILCRQTKRGVLRINQYTECRRCSVAVYYVWDVTSTLCRQTKGGVLQINQYTECRRCSSCSILCWRCNEYTVPPNQRRRASDKISIQSVADVPVAVYCVADVTSILCRQTKGGVLQIQSVYRVSQMF